MLQSSRDLGYNKGPRRKNLVGAFNKHEAGHRKHESQGILPRAQNLVTDDDLESSESTEAEVVPHDRTAQAPLVTFGSGLKRKLGSDIHPQPLVKRRSRAPKPRELRFNDDGDSWGGFSSANGSNESESFEIQSTGTQTDSDTSDIGTSSDNDASNSEGIEEKTSTSGKGEKGIASRHTRERSSAFKAWAAQQVNEALGVEPAAMDPQSALEGHHRITLSFKPREPEQEPLPDELITNTGVVTERKAYSVPIERTKFIQDLRIRLPVVAEEQKIMEAVYNNPSVVICGATGSGKTTQVPQFLYEAGFGDPNGPTPGMIGVTQPRRVAAVSMARRVSDELGQHEGKVSYQIRFESSTKDNTAIKFMTDGILIREIANDFALLKYSVIVIDEAHERSANTDILIGMVSRIVDLRDSMSKNDEKVTPLKLVIMSATLRISDFMENRNLFRNGAPPLLQAEGRQYPVTIHFARRTQWDYLEEIYHKVCKGHKRLPPGGMLVFLTGQNEIIDLAKRLRKTFASTPSSQATGAKVTIAASEAPLEAEDIDLGRDARDVDANDAASRNEDVDNEHDEAEFDIEETSTFPASPRVHVLPLYSQLQTKDQLRVFEPTPENSRLIVIATNVAETSLTIPGIRYVFDCGRAKEKRYEKATGVQSFNVDWISKASASQRAGRAGRTGPGHCYRLYSSAVYERDFREHTEPEILRMPVEGVVLQLKSMDLQHVLNFPFPTPPDRYDLAKAEKLLTYLGALTGNGKITAVGRELSIYPLSPRYAKMLVIGHQHGCMPYTIAMVSALAVPELFISQNQLDLSIPDRDQNSTYSTNDSLADESREQRKREYHRAHQILSKNSQTSDGIKALSAICAYAYPRNPEAFTQEMFLNSKAMKEASNLRRQLSTIVHNNHPTHLPSIFESRLPEPSSKQVKALQQFLAAAFLDQIAIRADVAPSPPEMPPRPRRAIDVPYLTLFKSHQERAEDLVDVAVFVHPSSVLARLSPAELPEYLIYSHLQRGTASTIDSVKKPRTRMIALCSVTGKQIAGLAKGTPLLEYSKPLGKIEEMGSGMRACWIIPELVGDRGRRWPLPAQKVLQKRQGNQGWLVEKVFN